MPFLSEQADGSLTLAVYIQPRSSRNRFVGPHGEALKLSITSPPVDGKANKAVLEFLARFFNLPKSALAIKQGQQSRTKVIAITGMDLGAARQALVSALPPMA